MDPELNRYVKSLVKLGIAVLAMLAIYLLISFLLPIIGKVFAYFPSLVLPFVLAVLMALIIEPLVVFFQKKARLKRAWAVALSLLIFVGSFIYIISWLISRVIRDLVRLFPKISAYSDQFTNSFLSAIRDFKLFYLQLNLPLDVQNSMYKSLQGAIEELSFMVSNSIDILTTAVGLLPGIFVFVVIAAIATFLISNDRYAIKESIYKFIPRNTQDKTSNIFNQLIKILVGFLRAYLILISITAVLTMIALKIIGVDYVLTIGIFVGLLDLLPVVGPGLLFVPWIVVEFILGNTSLGLGLTVIYLIISLVRQSIEPKIVGENIGLHPLLTLMALYFGLKLFGAVGLILGPVTVVIIVASYRAGLFDGLNWRKSR